MLALADKPFLNYLLDLVEHTRTDAAERLNYSAIKLLLVFNEQYMLHTPSHPTQSGSKLTYIGNPLLDVLADRLGRSATFGESLIFMLNRAGKGVFTTGNNINTTHAYSACDACDDLLINYKSF